MTPSNPNSFRASQPAHRVPRTAIRRPKRFIHGHADRGRIRQD